MPSSAVLKPESFAKRNRYRAGQFWEDQHLGEGEHKYVVKGAYKDSEDDEDHNGIYNAFKFMKTGTVFDSTCFEDDVRCAERSLPIIAAFHDHLATIPGASNISIKINIPEAWTQSSEGPKKGQYMLVEPYIENFRKFNSNTGAYSAEFLVAQALSHFSYHASDGQEILCDLQGGAGRNNQIGRWFAPS